MSRVTDCGHGKRGTRKGVRAKDEAGAYRQKATRVTCIGIYDGYIVLWVPVHPTPVFCDLLLATS